MSTRIQHIEVGVSDLRALVRAAMDSPGDLTHEESTLISTLSQMTQPYAGTKATVSIRIDTRT